MKSKFFAATSAAALLSLSFMTATPALAQAQFDDATATRLNALGFHPSEWVMTQEQALEIQTVVRNSESDQARQQRIRLIMGDGINVPATQPSARAANQFDDATVTRLNAIGFHPSDWVMTQEQALEIQTVVRSSESDQARQQRIRLIMGDAIVTETSGETLEESITTRLVALGFHPADWVITDAQALELRTAVSSSGSDQEKQGQVRQIMEIN